MHSGAMCMFHQLHRAECTCEVPAMTSCCMLEGMCCSRLRRFCISMLFLVCGCSMLLIVSLLSSWLLSLSQSLLESLSIALSSLHLSQTPHICHHSLLPSTAFLPMPMSRSDWGLVHVHAHVLCAAPCPHVHDRVHCSCLSPSIPASILGPGQL
jgi:hypothetical protein